MKPISANERQNSSWKMPTELISCATGSASVFHGKVAGWPRRADTGGASGTPMTRAIERTAERLISTTDTDRHRQHGRFSAGGGRCARDAPEQACNRRRGRATRRWAEPPTIHAPPPATDPADAPTKREPSALPEGPKTGNAVRDRAAFAAAMTDGRRMEPGGEVDADTHHRLRRPRWADSERSRRRARQSPTHWKPLRVPLAMPPSTSLVRSHRSPRFHDSQSSGRCHDELPFGVGPANTTSTGRFRSFFLVTSRARGTMSVVEPRLLACAPRRR
jgi:hypothetical protein